MIGLLNNSCTVWQHLASRDAVGGLSINYNGTFVAANIRCRIEDASAKQRLEYGTRRIDVTHIIFSYFPGFKNGMSIRAQDGRRYRLTAIEKRRAAGGLQTFYVIGAVEVEPPPTQMGMGLVLSFGKLLNASITFKSITFFAQPGTVISYGKKLN